VITIVDYGMANLGSILNMCRRLDLPAEATADPARLAAAERLILPGVGAFDQAMRRLEELGLAPLLTRRAMEDKVPTLGICLGMQLLGEGSEEGGRPGLGWLPLGALRFQFPAEDRQHKVPHMGWNVVTPSRPHPIFSGFTGEMRFYFVHSYYVRPRLPELTLGTTPYGTSFTAMVGAGNIVGAQFHPEKSHKFGMQLLRNFAGWDGRP
jgi:imidazole glycerol-phosphate synthase subunit HisH